METLIVIWIVCFIVNAIYFIVVWRKFLKTMKEPRYEGLRQLYNAFSISPSFRKLKKLIFNPFMYFVFAVILFIISPILFPSFVYSGVKKIFKIKNKLDKECEAEEEAYKKSEEWLKNEGEREPHIPEINDEIIKPEFYFEKEKIKLELDVSLAKKMLPELERQLELEYKLISEAVGDVITIVKLNESKIARELICRQFLIINRQDLKVEDV